MSGTAARPGPAGLADRTSRTCRCLSGWRVVWKGAPAVLITADAPRPLVKRDFVQAADYVITQAKAAGHNIAATAYSDQVLVVTGE